MYKGTWVIVANSSTARFLEATSNADLQVRETMEWPESRMKGSDLISDKPGRTFDRQGPGRHSYSASELSDIKTEEAKHFAQEIAQLAHSLVQENRAARFILIANPKFIGILNGLLDAQDKKIIIEKIDKDLTAQNPEEIRSYLPEVL